MAPEKICVAEPATTTLTPPAPSAIDPPKLAAAAEVGLSVKTDAVVPLLVTVPAPASEATCCVPPLRSSVEPAAIVRGVVTGRTLLPPLPAPPLSQRFVRYVSTAALLAELMVPL